MSLFKANIDDVRHSLQNANSILHKHTKLRGEKKVEVCTFYAQNILIGTTTPPRGDVTVYLHFKVYRNFTFW